jgi:hypothetical protein
MQMLLLNSRPEAVAVERPPNRQKTKGNHVKRLRFALALLLISLQGAWAQEQVTHEQMNHAQMNHEQINQGQMPAPGKSGYPLLLQTGETANGRTPLVDRQHPHDLLMELAASYRQKIGADSALFGYVGLPGEPALGPPAYMHRASGMDNPEAPLPHHWLDSTHILGQFGVLRGWRASSSPPHRSSSGDCREA